MKLKSNNGGEISQSWKCANVTAIFKSGSKTNPANFRLISLFCVEVLRPSQPNGVMSSAVSLPNHTFTGQA